MEIFMKKAIIGFTVLVSAWASEGSVALGTYEFNGNKSVTTQPDNATFGTFTKNFVTDGGTAGGLWTISGWDTAAAPDARRNIQFQITPSAGYTLNLEKIAFTANIDIDGPLNGRVSIFQQGSVVPVATTDFLFNEESTPYTFDFQDFTATETVTVRFYGWESFNSGGHVFYDNVALEGFTTVPEPAHTALAVFGTGLVGVSLFRRLQKRWAMNRAQPCA